MWTMSDRPTLVLHKSRFWLAHRNGRVAFESGVPMEGGNPYRRGSPSFKAFNESYDRAASECARANRAVFEVIAPLVAAALDHSDR